MSQNSHEGIHGRYVLTGTSASCFGTENTILKSPNYSSILLNAVPDPTYLDLMPAELACPVSDCPSIFGGKRPMDVSGGASRTLRVTGVLVTRKLLG